MSYVYNASANTWTAKSDCPNYIITNAALGSYVYVFGLSTAYRYDPSADIYTAIANPPAPYATSYGAKAFVVQNKLYLICSNGTKSALLYYNHTANSYSVINSDLPNVNANGDVIGAVLDDTLYTISYSYGNLKIS